jgi:hypothetical protein
MPPRIKTINPYKNAGELRRSQIITTFGSGAIVDLPRFSGIMAGIDDWKTEKLPEESKIHERNLEKMLGKKYFVQPSSPETAAGNTFGLRAYRFPAWYYCPECNRLDFYRKIAKPNTSNNGEFNSPLFCNNPDHGKEKIKLIPSRFIAACLNGHIDDFPYIWWVHRGNTCDNPRLSLEYQGSTGGLDSIHINCACGAHATMFGCMNVDSLKGLQCKGNSPWLGLTENGWYRDPRGCNARMRVIQRSANNVYYPVNDSLLTIPPWSGKLHAIFASKYSKFEDIFDENEETETKRRLKNDYQKFKDLYKCNEDSFIKESYKYFRDTEPADIPNQNSLRYEEYEAFCGKDKDEEYFNTESVEVPIDFSSLISRIKLVKKLREVMVLKGFRRINPACIQNQDERKHLGLSNDEYSPISKQPLEWLPAIELFGEGIFIQFNQKKVNEWEARNQGRYECFNKNLDPTWEWTKMFNSEFPKFILLHTFSHLLIRQLASQCGYATASIKEKIYSTFNDSDDEMTGVLIYTSATDTDGSLGGLVREGLTERMDTTLKSLLEEASWCSNDPICIESPSQGFNGLNLAACHACTLLPETSCEHFNCFLDRAAVTGLPDNLDIAFFKYNPDR